MSVEKISRNKKIIAMRKRKKLTYRQLGAIFNLNWMTVYGIVKREENRK